MYRWTPGEGSFLQLNRLNKDTNNTIEPVIHQPQVPSQQTVFRCHASTDLFVATLLGKERKESKSESSSFQQTKPTPVPLTKPQPQTLISVLNEFILQVNAPLIQTFLSDIDRSSDVVCLIGPSGSGKSFLIEHVAKNILKCKFHVYDTFVDIGSKTSSDGKRHRHPCTGLFSILLRDLDPFVFVIDGPEHECHKDFQQLIIREHDMYQKYRLPHKTIVLLVESLDTFILRDWVRKIGAKKYYLRTWMNYYEQQQLIQKLNSVYPLRRTDPIHQFVGDFRRMGIDLMSHQQQFQDRSNTIFEMTRLLLTWPLVPLRHRVACQVDSLYWMIARNQLQRIHPEASHEELFRLMADLSDVDMFMNTDEDNDLMIDSHIHTDRADIFALVLSIYNSNRRLGSTLRRDKYPIEYERSKRQVGPRLRPFELDDFTRKIELSKNRKS